MKYAQMKSLKLTLVVMLFIVAAGMLGCVTTDSPDEDPSEKYLGVWQVSDQPARLNYEVSIARNPSNSTEVLLDNFADLGGSAVGLVVGNSIIIDEQTIISGFQVEGTGSYISADELRFTYKLDDGIDFEDREAMFSR